MYTAWYAELFNVTTNGTLVEHWPLNDILFFCFVLCMSLRREYKETPEGKLLCVCDTGSYRSCVCRIQIDTELR